MGSPSAVRITPYDYSIIRDSLTAMTKRLQRSNRKAMYKHLDVDAAMLSLCDFEHAYIVSGCFLVVYSLGTPWYSNKLFLHELLVLRLMDGAEFGVVPQFLEHAAREAGAVLAAAGTALAKSDTALASLYQQHGFIPAGTTLVKEI